MATKHDTDPIEETRLPVGGENGWQKVAKQLLAIFGAIAIFLGFFILFAGENQSLGFWDSTWTVGEISEWWGYGFLAGGTALWAIALGWMMAGRRRRI